MLYPKLYPPLVRNDMFRYECEGAERAAPQPEFIAPNDLVLLGTETPRRNC